MDDLILNNKSSLMNLKGKNWSSLQNLESEDSEESSELNYHQNGFINTNNLVNGEFNDKYTNSSDDSSLPLIKHCDTSKLNREDMCIYGLRPAYDQFYLVVCEYCKKVVKPQALSKHIEVRHSNNNLINNNDNLLNDNEFLKHNDDNNDFNRQQSNLRTNSLLATSLTRDDLELEKLKQQKSNSQTKLKSSLFKPLDSKSNSSSNSIASSPLTDNNNSLITIAPTTTTNLKPKLTKTKLLPCKDRKYDPDKHCGVKLNEQDSPCTRSLTCKTHSLTLRRQVPNRSNSFDILLNEHRLAKEAALRAAGIEVKPTKLQLKQQQRMQKNNQLKEQQLKQQQNNNSKLNNQILNKTTFNGNQTTQPIQLKIHLQSPTASNLNTSPFKTFNQLHHQNESNNNNTINSSQLNTALQSPTNSFVNINNLPFTSSQQSPTIKQFTFTNNNNQLGKLLSSPSRTNFKPTINNFNNNNNQSTSLLTSSIQVINQTNLNNNYNHLDNKLTNNSQYYDQSNKNYSTNSLIQQPSQQIKPFNCDINPSSTLNHYPKPAAVCTFNERRLSILTPSNKKILSSKLYNRKADFSFSAISILCNKEKIINNNKLNEQLTSPIKQNNKLNKSIKQQNLQNLNSNSQASNCSISSSNGNRTTNDYLSSNSNSQETFQTNFLNQNSNLFNQTNQF